MKRSYLILIVLLLCGCTNQTKYQYLTFANNNGNIVIKAFNNKHQVKKISIKNEQLDNNFNIYQNDKDLYLLAFDYKRTTIKKLNKKTLKMTDVSQANEHPTFLYLNQDHLYYSSNYLSNNHIIVKKATSSHKIKINNFFINKMSIYQGKPFLILEDTSIHDYLSYNNQKTKLKGNIIITSDILYKNNHFYFIVNDNAHKTLLYKYNIKTNQLSATKMKVSFTDFTFINHKLHFINTNGIYDQDAKLLYKITGFNKISYVNNKLIINSYHHSLVLDNKFNIIKKVSGMYIIYK